MMVWLVANRMIDVIQNMQGGVIAVENVNLGDLIKVGINARPKVATVDKVLTWQPSGKLQEVIFGPDAPAVVPGNGNIVIIGLNGDAALRLASQLSARLGRDVAVATFSAADDVYTWALETPTGRSRTEVAMPGQAECLELIRRRTGIVLQDGDTAIPVDIALSWRDSAPQSVQDDMDNLTDATLRLGTQLLEKHGHVEPYAFGIKTSGEQNIVDVHDQGPDTLAHLASLYGALTQTRDDYRCIAVLTDVTVDGGDALCVALEHATGLCMNVYLPYRKARFGSKYRYGDLMNGSADPRIWK